MPTMSEMPTTIHKKPVLRPAEDFYFLRRTGIDYIVKTGSRFWTDYNTHDPGITILEALCYVITDLAYRSGWDIKDLLAEKPTPGGTPIPYRNQAFFPARDILTVNPTTPDDFRRLLIDLEQVRNAWLTGEAAPLGGLYNVLLELEEDRELGDLNTGKIEYACTISEAGAAPRPLKIELRFPEWGLVQGEEWQLFLKHGTSLNFAVTRLGDSKTSNALIDPQVSPNDFLHRNWRKLLYLDLTAPYPAGLQHPPGTALTIKNVTMRIYGDALAKDPRCCENLISLLEDRKIPQCNGTKAHFTRRHREKELQRLAAVASAKNVLQAHRNLAEDFYRVKVVDVEEVAVCADVEVKPDADIEQVQAQIWFKIESYFTPSVPFHTLGELLESGQPVEEIFNGPALDNGFLRAQDLAESSRKTVLSVSDLVNRLMDIDDVIAVNKLQLTKFDSAGNIVRGQADPGYNNGSYQFDPAKISASWILYLSEDHQPRFYLNGSRFLFYKNGLPFLPRMDEARDTLIHLRGVAERPKSKSTAGDLPAPAGVYRDPEEYYPVQYGFPLTYGIGPEGLPSQATEERKAQAKQLKAYLMVFEQILGNAFSQLAQVKELFSLDYGVARSYFFKEFNKKVGETTKDEIIGAAELVDDKKSLAGMQESVPDFHKRRNRFLDHLMARFGEDFNEYALLLNNLQGQQVALDQLVSNKISFLKAFPLISHDRARSFNRTLPCIQANQASIKKRVRLLLGIPERFFVWSVTTSASGIIEQEMFQLQDGIGKILFTTDAIKGHQSVCKEFIKHLKSMSPGDKPNRFQVVFRDDNFQVQSLNKDARSIRESSIPVAANGKAKALGEGLEKAVRKLLLHLSRPNDYRIAADTTGGFRLDLQNQAQILLGACPQSFATRGEAKAFRNDLAAWSASERIIVVEHLLLRPKFPGDTLYPQWPGEAGAPCGVEDPYSFRLTFVMPGWAAPFDTNLELRDFAERTIKQEIPSHLIAKVCWVGMQQFRQFEEAWLDWLEAEAGTDWTEARLQERVEAILLDSLEVADNDSAQKGDLDQCAGELLAEYGNDFHKFLESSWKPTMTAAQLKKLFLVFSADKINGEGTLKNIYTQLEDRFVGYLGGTWRLRVVVDLLSLLNNVYPSATLHDWDEGNDQNPVRLGKTALGD